MIDYISSWGPMILGHAFEPVIEAVKKRAERGTSFGMPTELETQIAELAVQMVPNIDKIRMVNSGTEACMSAIRLARGYTVRGKDHQVCGLLSWAFRCLFDSSRKWRNDIWHT